MTENHTQPERQVPADIATAREVVEKIREMQSAEHNFTSRDLTPEEKLVARDPDAWVMEHKFTADNFLTPEVRERQAALYEATPYPFPDGEVTVLGPETFIDREEEIISHKGENFYNHTALQQDHFRQRYIPGPDAGGVPRAVLGEKPVTTDLLHGIFARQGHFQALLGNETWKMSDGELVGYLKDQILAMLDESHEALNELGWKPWATSRHINEEEFKGELVDVLCFLVNLALGVGLTANDFAALHAEKVGRNIKRQREGYDGVTGKCPGCNRAIDDLRAKGLPVGNFGGVDYCSTECIESTRTRHPNPAGTTNFGDK